VLLGAVSPPVLIAIMSSHHSTSVCSLKRPSQTSIRNFFAPSDRSHRTLPISHRKRKGGSPNQIPAAGDAEERSSSSSSSSQRTVAATPPLRNHCSNINQRSSKRANVTLPKKKKHQQLYLDLGQKNFAENTECEICGMLFVHGLTEDAKRHATICQDYKRGVPFASFENARVVQKDKLALRDKNKKLQQRIFIVEVRTQSVFSVTFSRKSFYCLFRLLITSMLIHIHFLLLIDPTFRQLCAAQKSKSSQSNRRSRAWVFGE